jgi:hypothetical protein
MISHSSGSERHKVPADRIPQFCPRCRKSRTLAEGFGTGACPACCELLLASGYCPVCEAFLPQPVGSLCPKHDLELECKPPPRIPVDPEGKPFRWVTVGRFTDSQSAQPPRIRLEAEGIPTFLEGERMGSRAMYAVATGGAKLKVPEDLAGDARIILSQTWTVTAAALDIEDNPDEDVIEPEDFQELPTDGGSFRGSLLFFLLVGLPSLLLLYLLLRSMGSEP